MKDRFLQGCADLEKEQVSMNDAAASLRALEPVFQPKDNKDEMDVDLEQDSDDEVGHLLPDAECLPDPDPKEPAVAMDKKREAEFIEEVGALQVRSLRFVKGHKDPAEKRVALAAHICNEVHSSPWASFAAGLIAEKTHRTECSTQPSREKRKREDDNEDREHSIENRLGRGPPQQMARKEGSVWELSLIHI